MAKPIKLNVSVDTIRCGEKCDDLHEYCESVSNKISEHIESNKTDIPLVLLDRYIYVVCNNILCWTVDYDRNIKFLNYIFKNCTVDSVRIMNTIKENPELIEILIKNNKEIDMNFFQKIPNSDDLFLKYIEKFIKDPNCTEKTLEAIFNTAVDRKYFKSVNKILDMKFNITDSKTFDNVIFGLVGIKEDVEKTLKKCINNGSVIKKETLKNFIDKIEKSNFYQYQCFNFISIVSFLYTNGSIVSIDDILKVRPKVPIGDLNATINHINELNQIEITRDEFKKMCESSIKLTNFKNVKKYFEDKEIKAIIYSNKISYPIEFDFDINILRNECKKTGNINDIKKILKVVKPDEVCMENACSVMNLNLIKLLREEYNLPITEKCIYNGSKTFGYNRIVSMLVENYEKENNINVPVIEDNDYKSDELSD